MRTLLAVCLLLFSLQLILAETKTTQQQVQPPKREFRGTWIHTVAQSEYATISTAEMQKNFIRKLNYLQKCGINAILFQVRPEADAWYESQIEPWSRFLTGKQGVAPSPKWDPMAFLIKECHKRNMEFHAWLNPYRVSVSGGSDILSKNHLYFREPSRFIHYRDLILFDPGIPDNRKHICQVIRDIVTRYDVDGIHMDDYFYPYPAKDQDIPDDKSFKRYGLQMGWQASQRDDWRRDNVNSLIQEIKQTILETKPWVRFGISPFGIYRNKKSTPDGSGSNTTGLECYSALYADVIKWVRAGWIDYNMPQLYWEIGHTAADYDTLVKWWNKHTYKQHLYIGQNVVRTMAKKQLRQKMDQSRLLSKVDGNCFWPANELLNNTGGIADQLRTNYFRYPALIPAYTQMNPTLPDEVKKLSVGKSEKGYILQWNTEMNKKNPTLPYYFVIYRVSAGSPKDLNNPKNIVGITRSTSYFIPFLDKRHEYDYGVTAVNRYHNESSKGIWKRLRP